MLGSSNLMREYLIKIPCQKAVQEYIKHKILKNSLEIEQPILNVAELNTHTRAFILSENICSKGERCTRK